MTKSDAKFCALAIAAGVALIAAIVLAMSALADYVKADERAGERICFSAATWSADDGRRPCWYAYGPLEDGSGRLYIGRANRYATVCTIPAADERPRAIACKGTVADD